MRTDVAVGVTVTEAEMFWAVMVLGLLALGKVPKAWSGRPLAVIDRVVALKDQVVVAVLALGGLTARHLSEGFG